MNTLPRLLCLAALATAAFAQTPAPTSSASDPAQPVDSAAAVESTATAPSEAAVVPQAALAQRPDLQPRSSAPAVLPIATVLRLKLDRPISTASAKPGEQFTATLTKPVEVGGQTVIPAGTIVNCSIIRAHGARRFAGKPLLSIKAVSLQLPSGKKLDFMASVVDTSNPHHLDVDEEGNVHGASPNPMNKVEMGALAGTGAIAGAVIAGPEGFLIGTASGAAVAAGHIVVKHRELTLPAGTELIFELDAPASTLRPQMGGMQ